MSPSMQRPRLLFLPLAFIVILSSAIPHSERAALRERSLPANQIMCFPPDPTTDPNYTNQCEDLVQDFDIDSNVPDYLLFGDGGLQVPWSYRGLPGKTHPLCEARVDWEGEPVASVSATAGDILEGLLQIIVDCIFPRPSRPIACAGGYSSNIGEGGALRVTLGQYPLPPRQVEDRATTTASEATATLI